MILQRNLQVFLQGFFSSEENFRNTSLIECNKHLSVEILEFQSCPRGLHSGEAFRWNCSQRVDECLQNFLKCLLARILVNILFASEIFATGLSLINR